LPPTAATTEAAAALGLGPRFVHGNRAPPSWYWLSSVAAFWASRPSVDISTNANPRPAGGGVAHDAHGVHVASFGEDLLQLCLARRIRQISHV
jgi:hypothetical protein